MKFAYIATDSSGVESRGTIRAGSVDEATDKLFDRGLVPTSVTEDAGGSGGSDGARRGRAAATKDLTAFARQLALLTEVGTPLVQAISAYERQLEDSPWRTSVTNLRTGVEEGRSLADAMALDPAFPPIFRSLIEAGEAGGKLPPMLQRLVEMSQRQLRTRNIVRGALAYPSLLMCIAVAVVIVMLTVVLPRFGGMFETLDAPMPASTKVMMDASAFVRTEWPWIVGGVVAAGFALFAAWRTDPVRARFEAMLIDVPVVGPVIRNLAAARMTRVLGVLLQGRVPMLEALELTSHAAGLASYRALIARCVDTVTLGEPMSSVMSKSPLIPPAIAEAVQTGESTGRLGEVLVNLADYLDEENESKVKSLTSLLEPLILLLMGLVVGGMSVSMFLPLFDLTASAATT